MHQETNPPLIRPVGPGHWRTLDRLAALAYLIPALLLLAGHARGWAGWLAVPVGSVLVTLPLAWRRRSPAGSLAMALAGTAAIGILQPRSIILGLAALACALYTLAAACQPRTALIGLAVSLTAAVATALPDFQHRGGAVLFSLLYLITWTVGFTVGMHRRYTANLLRGQAHRAEAQAEKARRRVTEQRMGIARELHDVLAHHLSVITVQAGYAGLVIDQQPDQARAALGTIESAGRQTLDELRRLLGVLRTEDPDAAAAELAPAPGLADLDRLAELTAQAGVRVDLTVTGRPRPLPTGIDLSAYRIVQEALTNVVKHAAATTAQAGVDYQDDQLVIEVCDQGPGRPSAAQSAAGGRGLAGMRERTALYGGELHAEPLPGRGFKVTARLPLPEQRPA
ncbi:sensor histidine kinase [Streptomyces sp. NPDC051976]|uniref:sensor histidine kinase n=1 Tax=Streptomyces sp. NPDC051976 TaxID=3154947 RepID=UPI003420B8ED